jgi:thiol-disulfide isomerase/thioredoxin
MTPNTRFLLLALVLAQGALLQGCGNEETSTPVVAEAPTPTPAVTVTNTPTPAAAMTTKFQDLEGNPLELSAYAGKKVFLNYWATWCAPCIREIPSITRATAELEDENYVFLLASDESLETIKDFVADREFTGNFIKLNAFFGAHGINAVPSSELYDENGALVVTWSGAFEWDSAEMLTAIRNGTPVEAAPAQ